MKLLYSNLRSAGGAAYGLAPKCIPAVGSSASGYTLFELVMVMLIVSILATISVPSFKYVTSSNRTATEVNALLGDMQFARSEATKEGQWVTVCAAIVPATGVAPANCSAGSNWSTGWIVFSDVNGDHSYGAGAGDVILRVQPALTGTDTFQGGSSLSAAMFNREGFAQAFAGTTPVTLPVNITLHATPSTTAWTHCLVISLAGMPTSEGYSLVTPVCT